MQPNKFILIPVSFVVAISLTSCQQKGTSTLPTPIPPLTSTRTPLVPNDDEIFAQKIIGTWETKRIETDGSVLVGEESYYPSKEVSGAGVFTIDNNKDPIAVVYSGKWRIEGGYLYTTITSSNLPELIPLGYISAAKIIKITDKDLVYEQDGRQYVDQRKN